MWIMLTSKLPTRPSPPRMSIFWSVPWPDGRYSAQQARRCQFCGYTIKRYRDGSQCACKDGPYPVTVDTRLAFDDTGFGKIPNWVGARAIHFANHTLRVFPHEFSMVSTENMRAYVLGLDGEGPSHDLVAEGVASERAINAVLESDQRMVYDAALVDGATHAQAMATALEMDITIETSEFPPIGWYRCRPEYGLLFSEPDELIEDRRSVSELEVE